MADDWLDESGDTLLTDNNTYMKIQQDREKDGYRAGISSGKEATLQRGFNEGYSKALNISMELAHYRGVFNAVLCHSIKQDHDSREKALIPADCIPEIEGIVQELSDAEKRVSSVVFSEKNEERVSRSGDLGGESKNTETARTSSKRNSDSSYSEITSVLAKAKTVISKYKLAPELL